MVKLRPYLSLDLETTGLDVEKVQILQIGWVIDDGVSEVKDLKRGSILIKNETITYGEDYAIGMNAWIFQELMKKAKDRTHRVESFQTAIREFHEAICEASELGKQFDIQQGSLRPSSRVQIAGKNAGVFDFPIVINNLKREMIKSNNDSVESDLEEFRSKIDHKFIDVGDLYFTDFGKNIGFNQIQKLIGQPEITHDALEDALAVVIGIRFKMNLPTK